MPPLVPVLIALLAGLLAVLLRAFLRERARLGVTPVEAREPVGRIVRERCPRCGGPGTALIGTGRGYRCEGCGLGFVGLAHHPSGPARRSA